MTEQLSVIIDNAWDDRDQISVATQGEVRDAVKTALAGLDDGRRPRFQELEDQGGGPRGLVDAIAALVCWNPKGLGEFAATS